MNIIQVALVILVFVILVYFLNNRSTHTTKAWKKISFILFGLFMIVTILFPDITNDIAHLVGVGRGADLLLYLLATAFVFQSISTYIRFQEQRNEIFKLARSIAIADAKTRYRDL